MFILPLPYQTNSTNKLKTKNVGSFEQIFIEGNHFSCIEYQKEVISIIKQYVNKLNEQV